MAKFLTGHNLNSALEDIFKKANTQLVLISPYVKLHSHFKSAMETKLGAHDLEIVIVFGKNERDPTKSMKKVDLDFFKEFPNIEIRYNSRLHAKYYANQSNAILTSMNLYDYSQDNNIEAGILTASGLFGKLGSKIIDTSDETDTETWKFFNDVVIHQAQLLYCKEPMYEKGLMGLTKKYIGSEVTTDDLDSFFAIKQNKPSVPYTPKPFYKATSMGYCIRSGEKIIFNIHRPLCDKCYQVWSGFGYDVKYKQNYCHFTGEASNKTTSWESPIMRKNWKASTEAHPEINK